MSSADGLAAPGSSTYDSSTMYVGDGTWDTERNTFLLPNLQGLNFATMRYNGMGNRFRDLPQYHSLIMGHGIVAAITFLIIVPAAIFSARYLHSAGRLAYKLHVYLQILTVFLSTVVFMLGWFAVGPERSLTNPHHGIGLAIYVCVLVQFLYGWWMAGRERKRSRPHPTIPLKVHLHRLFGRAIALLAFVQVALGLTLYGSPEALFILYALWGALLLFLYLALEYWNKPQIGSGGPPPGPARSEYYSDYTGSYLTGDQTELTQDGGRRQSRKEQSHWGRDILAGAGAIGVYEWWQDRKARKQDEKDDRIDQRRRRQQRPPQTPGPESSLGPAPSTPGPQRPGYGPPGPAYGPPGSTYGPPRSDQGRPGRAYGPPGSAYNSRGPSGGAPPPPAGYAPARAPSRGSQRSRRNEGPVISPQTWEQDDYEDEKYGRPTKKSGTWRDRILGAGAGIAAFEGFKNMFGGKRRRNDGYVDSQVSFRPTETDVSRVEAGQTPYSPNDPRQDRRPMPDPGTPTRPPRRRPASEESMSLADDDEVSYAGRPPRQSTGPADSLWTTMRAIGPRAGFNEWNQRKKERREDERRERERQDEITAEQRYNRRHSNTYPTPQHASGRRQSLSGTVMTGPTGPDPALGSNPELSRTNFRPDTSHPPLPATAGAFPSGNAAPPSTAGPSISQHNVQQNQTAQGIPYPLPPPPPGPPPNAARATEYQAPVPGSLQMPEGQVNPDPSRLVSEPQARTQPDTGDGLFGDGATAAAAAVGAGAAASQRRQSQSQSPSRRRDSRTRFQRPSRRGSSVAASGSQLESPAATSPPISVKVNMHPDGRHVTLRRLPEEEAARLRDERRQERKTRRGSSLSSGGEGASSSRFRRNGGGIRRSSDQPITNVPPPPAMSNSAIGSHRRDSELNLPPAPPPAPASTATPQPQMGRVPQASSSPSAPPSGLLPAVGPSGGSAGGMGSPPPVAGTGTDVETGTDLSNFDQNRRRRRAERARRLEAARGNRGVEFS